MDPITIVVWDNIGNTLLGVRPWSSWSPEVAEWLLAEDPAGAAHAPSFAELFAGRAVELRWFVNDLAAPGIFGSLRDDFPGAARALEGPHQLAAEIAGADFLVLHKETLPAEALAGATKLRLIQHLGQDHRGVPLEAARAMGIPVAATPLVNYIAVAEHVWAFVLNHFKRLPALREHMRRREYDARWNAFPGLLLARDRTLGLLGFGEIARPIARIAQAFDMRCLYWDLQRWPEFERRYGVEYADWEDLFRRSDVLSVQLALNDNTEGIVGAREIGWLKPDALFVNTARGKLVDQAALTAALADGRLGGAALDVFAEEPLPPDDPLHALHERPDGAVTLTPHLAWQSPWTWIRDSLELWQNVQRVLAGEEAHHLL